MHRTAPATENDLDPMPAGQKLRNPLPTKSGGRLLIGACHWKVPVRNALRVQIGKPCLTLSSREGPGGVFCVPRPTRNFHRALGPSPGAGAHFTCLVYSICLLPCSKSCLRQLEPVTTTCIVNLQVRKEAPAQLPG